MPNTMSLIDLVARTASREELVELLRGTEEKRQKLHEALAAMVRHTPASVSPAVKEARDHAKTLLG